MRHLERQIEEFYGPLFNLVLQIVIANQVQQRILSGSPTRKLSEEQADKVRRFFQDRHFFPVHAEISQILKTRRYLVEGAAMPQPFYKYPKARAPGAGAGVMPPYSSSRARFFKSTSSSRAD